MSSKDHDLRHLDAKIDKVRIREKDEKALKVIESVFDEQTALLVVKFLNQGVIKEISHVISTGKEANVYHAYGTDGDEFALKIYRTTTVIFKDNWKYVQGDPRFKKYNKSTYEFIYLWAKKEFKNLQRMKKAGIPVPSPIKVQKNILIMDFIGEKQNAAPLLRDAKIKRGKMGKIYGKMVDYLTLMYEEGKMVHADLSEYNILFHKKKPVVIDVSQAVLLDHPQAPFFLYRDVMNINRYFSKFVETLTDEELFEQITGSPPNPQILIELNR